MYGALPGGVGAASGERSTGALRQKAGDVALTFPDALHLECHIAQRLLDPRESRVFHRRALAVCDDARHPLSVLEPAEQETD
jgi:hypothetical protein